MSAVPADPVLFGLCVGLLVTRGRTRLSFEPMWVTVPKFEVAAAAVLFSGWLQPLLLWTVLGCSSPTRLNALAFDPKWLTAFEFEVTAAAVLFSGSLVVRLLLWLSSYFGCCAAGNDVF